MMRDGLKVQFDRQGALVGRFGEARAEFAMNGNRGADHLFGQNFVIRLVHRDALLRGLRVSVLSVMERSDGSAF